MSAQVMNGTANDLSVGGAGVLSEAPKHTVIIGGGPAGLTAAYELMRRNARSTTIERDIQVGGLAKTVKYKGYGFDIGGHRFFTKIGRVERFWREILAGEFIRVPRLSRIYYRGKFFNYPLKPMNALTGLGIGNSFLIVSSYIWARLRPLPNEDFFEAYMVNHFGRRLFNTFFKTYTEKVWGTPCSEIRGEWAAQRIKGLSLIQAVWNAFFGDKNSKVKSLIDEFDYPRLGPGQLWERVADRLVEGGNALKLSTDVQEIRHAGGAITSVVCKSEGKVEEIRGDYFFSTMPLRTLVSRLNPAAPDKVVRAAQGLRYRDFISIDLIVDRPQLFPDNWIYIHSPEVQVGRIQNFKNWSKDLCPDPNKTSLGLEYFCFETDPIWSMTDEEMVKLGAKELEILGLARASEVLDGTVMRVKKAYPMYDADYKANLAIVRDYLATFPNLQALGRNGLHKYNNQDHSMLTAFLGIENLLEGGDHAIWEVNSDSEYHEEKREKPGAAVAA